MRTSRSASAITICALALAVLPSSARADLELCNRTSFVIETVLGIEDQGAAATRGWFRVDPGQCRMVLRGELTAERLFVHARTLPLYGAVRPLHGAAAHLCVGTGDFLIADARRCSGANERLVPFAQMQPQASDAGLAVHVAEPADYDAEQAALAAIQRLLVLAGYDAEPIDGLAGPRTASAIEQFLRERALPGDTASSPAFLDLLLQTARAGSGPGLQWCNETAYTVMAALGIEEESTIVARGWWRVEPNACLRPELPRRAIARVYSFAEAVDQEGEPARHMGKPLAWGGATLLCVRNTRFEIREHNDCNARGLVSQGFATVDLADRDGTTVRFRAP